MTQSSTGQDLAKKYQSIGLVVPGIPIGILILAALGLRVHISMTENDAADSSRYAKQLGASDQQSAGLSSSTHNVSARDVTPEQAIESLANWLSSEEGVEPHSFPSLEKLTATTPVKMDVS